MSLVVARIVEENIYIHSDSKVTDINVTSNDQLKGLLKTLILHPFICVSFAGNVYYAELAIERFFNTPIEDVTSLLQMLLDTNVESGNSTDFILATINCRVPRLFKVSSGEVRGVQNAWIGDLAGFELYQSEFHSQETEMTIKMKMSSAFSAVIYSDSIKSIGGFHISTELDYDISPEHPVFMHAMSAEMVVTELQTIAFERKNQPKPIPLGTTAGGSHGISYLRTVSPVYHGIAIHFTHGNFGILFCPQIDLKGIIIKEVGGKEFINHIKIEYDIPLQGFIKVGASILQYVDTRYMGI